MCRAKRLKLGDGRALVFVNRLCIRLEDTWIEMAHYLSNKDRGDARLGDAARKTMPKDIAKMAAPVPPSYKLICMAKFVFGFISPW